MKKIIFTLLTLCISPLYADYSFKQSINKTLVDKTALALAGLSIVFLTRAKTIIDYSAVYQAEKWIDETVNEYREDVRQRREANIPPALPSLFGKRTEVLVCSIIGAFAFGNFIRTFINNGY